MPQVQTENSPQYRFTVTGYTCNTATPVVKEGPAHACSERTGCRMAEMHHLLPRVWVVHSPRQWVIQVTGEGKDRQSIPPFDIHTGLRTKEARAAYTAYLREHGRRLRQLIREAKGIMAPSEESYGPEGDDDGT